MCCWASTRPNRRASGLHGGRFEAGTRGLVEKEWIVHYTSVSRDPVQNAHREVLRYMTMRALSGVTVLDLGAGLFMGPYCGGLLMQRLGADVIKVEPPQGEPYRSAYGAQKGLEAVQVPAC